MEEVNKNNIERKIKEFDKKNKDDEQALRFLFDTFPNNNLFIKVVPKVATLNALYKAGIKNKDVNEIANRIITIDRIDIRLHKGDLSVVKSIGEKTEKMNRSFVFASKYCNFHNPDKYPIFDHYSWFALYNIGLAENFKNKLKRKDDGFDYEDYNCYCKSLDEFLKYYDLNINYKKADQFLWLHGKELEGKK